MKLPRPRNWWEEIYEMASEDGHRDLDYAATITLLEKWAGVQIKSEAA